MVAHVFDGSIDEVFRQMIVGTEFPIDLMVVLADFGHVLSGTSRQEAVEAVEASGQWPVVERTAWKNLMRRGQMPFSDHVRSVPLIPQHRRQQHDIPVDDPSRIRKAGIDV